MSQSELSLSEAWRDRCAPSPDLRLGVAYDFVDSKFSDGLITGTVNGVPGSLPFVRAETKALGLNLDNTVHLVTAQATYSLPMVGPVRPYLGGGAGLAIISHTDTQFAFTATAGFRSSLGDNSYWGVRYRFYWINGPTDDLGIRYQPIMNHSVMVLVGTYLD